MSKSNQLVDVDTGEVILKPKWQGMYNGVESEALDFSNPLEPVYEEIPPYTKGEDGKWLNDTSESKFVQTGFVNVQERIQSYLDDVDIYKILAKIAQANDESMLHLNDCRFGDIADIPTNFNDYHEFMSNNLEKMPSELVAVLNNPDHTEAQLRQAIFDYNQKQQKVRVSKDIYKEKEDKKDIIEDKKGEDKK